MRRLLLAFQFLTIIPINKNLAAGEEDFGKSMVYFPLVGLILGLILVCADLGLSLCLPRSVVDGLLIVLLTVLTGALHLDALADTADAVGSGKGRVEKLRIMKDSHIGAMGTTAICVVIITKYLSLSALPPSVKHQSILVMLMLARWSQVCVACLCEYAGLEKGMGHSFAAHVTHSRLITASAVVWIALFVLLGKEGIIVGVFSALFCFLYGLYFKRMLGGVTGDVLGAASEIIEVAVLILIVMIF